MHKIPSLFLAGSNGRDVDPDHAWVFDEPAAATTMYDGLSYAVINGAPYAHAVSAELTPDMIVCGAHGGRWWGWAPVPADDLLFWHTWYAYDRTLFDWSYELVGPEINGNPERAPTHVLIPHGRLVIHPLAHPTPEAIRAYLAARPVEGVVFWEDLWDPLCRKAKVQHTDFNLPRRTK